MILFIQLHIYSGYRFTDADDGKDYKWGKTEIKKEGDKNEGEKEKPNFGLSGKLTADANTVNGVVVKYTEPDDAKQPKRRWRYVLLLKFLDFFISL